MKKNTQNVQDILDRLIETYPNESELLAIPHQYTDSGLAKCSRIELQELAEAAPGKPTIVGLGLPVEYVIRIARFTVALAYMRSKGKSAAAIQERAQKYEASVRSIIHGFKDKNAVQAQRRADKMTTEQTATETVETSKPAKKGAKKAPGAKAKGVKAAAAAPKTKGKKTAEQKEAEFNAAMAKPVKAVRKAADGELPKQAAIIVNTLKTIGKTTIGALIQQLEKDGELVTKQPMVAIWSFYRARLINEGFIEVTE